MILLVVIKLLKTQELTFGDILPGTTFIFSDSSSFTELFSKYELISGIMFPLSTFS